LIRVVVVAPTAAVRAGLAVLLEGDTAITVVGQASSLPNPASPEFEPDVVILYTGMGGRLPPGSLVEGGSPDGTLTPHAILLVTDNPDDIAALAGMPLRGWGALLPDTSAEELQAAVHALAEGLIAGSPVLLRQPWGTPLALNAIPAVGEEINLTNREMEILRLLSRGLANKQIAEALKISPHTVKFHIGSIYQKLGATNRAEAVRLGIQQGKLTL
jgi:DNA-binding NarL/FixJ family response regulator